MATATITSKGQVTIPQRVRADMKLSSGDRIDFVRMEDGNYAVVPASARYSCSRGLSPSPTSRSACKTCRRRSQRVRRSVDRHRYQRPGSLSSPGRRTSVTAGHQGHRSADGRPASFITTVVLVETVWVLTRAYKMSRPQNRGHRRPAPAFPRTGR